MPGVAFTDDFGDALHVIAAEVGVLEVKEVGSLKFGLLEVVHIQLSNKGCKVTVLEVLSKHTAELVLILNYEAPTVGSPAHNIMEILAGEHGVDLGEERRNAVFEVGIWFSSYVHVFNT